MNEKGGTTFPMLPPHYITVPYNIIGTLSGNVLIQTGRVVWGSHSMKSLKDEQGPGSRIFSRYIKILHWQFKQTYRLYWLWH